MAQSNYSAGVVLWCAFLVAFLLASWLKAYPAILVSAIILFPLTGFLVIRGVIRWTGKQWQHGAAQGQRDAR